MVFPSTNHVSLGQDVPPALRKAGLSRCHASPLMRSSLVQLRAQQPGRTFNTTGDLHTAHHASWIAIWRDKRVRLGTVYYSPPPRISRPRIATFPPPRSRFALFALVIYVPLGRGSSRYPPPMSVPKGNRLKANSFYSCHISQAVAPRQHWQCSWLWLHRFGVLDKASCSAGLPASPTKDVASMSTGRY